MCLKRHTNVRFQQKSKKRRYNNFEKHNEPLVGEFETDYVEIVSRKRKITDNIPGKTSCSCPIPIFTLVIYNFYILANSKLHILKSINFFIDNLDTTGFRINYMDTGNKCLRNLKLKQILDSLVMSLSKPLDDLVLPGRQSHWEAGRPKWFVMNPDCPDQKREPGKLKQYFIIMTTLIIYKFYTILFQDCLRKNFQFKAVQQFF